MPKDKLSILLCANSFPSSEKPAKSPFNLRLAKQLSNYANIKVLVFRTISPNRIKSKQYVFEGIEVTELYFPLVPFGSQFIPFSSTRFMQGLSIFVGRIWLMGFMSRLKRPHIIHSVSAGNTAILGAELADRLGSKHFIQLIGSDINIQLPILKRLRAFRLTMSKSSGIIANSFALANKFRAAQVQSPEVRVIYRGASLQALNPEIKKPPQLNANKFSFLYLGGLIKSNEYLDGNKKGGITLIKAWSLNESYFQKHKAFLCFGGPILGTTLEQCFAEFQNTNSIIPIGEVSPKCAHTFIANASAVIIPSLQEGMPNVLMEAMCAGKPIIASDVGGIPELIEHEKTGLLVMPGDPDSLFNAMKQLVSDKQLAQNLGRNAKGLAKKKLDGALYGKTIIEYYQNQISNENNQTMKN